MSRIPRLLVWYVLVAGFAGLPVLCVAADAAPPHPVLTHDVDKDQQSRWEKSVAEALALAPADLVAIVPVQTPYVTEDCPSCGAVMGLSRGPRHGFKGRWDLAHPHQFACPKCDTVYPNPKFPQDHRQTLLNTLGEKVELPSHRAANGKEYLLAGPLYTAQGLWAVEKLEHLSKLYHVTHDERYARAAVLLLDRFAQVFPHYLVRETTGSTEEATEGKGGRSIERARYTSTGGPWMRNGKPIPKPAIDPNRGQRPAKGQGDDLPYSWVGILWGGHVWAECIPMPLVRAYDLVYDSPEFEKLSKQLGTDVHGRIEQMFRTAASYVLEFPFWCHVNSNVGNSAGDLVLLGRVIGEPEYVHFGYRWAREICEQYVFSRDGMFAESIGYMGVFLASRAGGFGSLTGYADPPGYRGKEDGLHLDFTKLDLPAVAFLQKGATNRLALRFPNGSLPPIGDARGEGFARPNKADGNVTAKDIPPLEQSRSLLLPGYGHAILGDGSGDLQTQVHLHFQPGGRTTVTHAHNDTLSLMLWAFGRELFTDLGYHRGRYRDWTARTLSHNTVVVDRIDHDGENRKGNVLLYEPNLAGLSAIQVDAPGAYAGKTSRFRRTLVLNTIDPATPYLVDVFEVEGGATHDYLLHGASLYDQTAECSLKLVPMPGDRPLLERGETWVEPQKMNAPISGEGYGIFRNVRMARAKESFHVTYRLTAPYEEPKMAPMQARYAPLPDWWFFRVDPNAFRDRLDLGTRTHVLIDSAADRSAMEVCLGESPSLVRSGFFGSDLSDKIVRPSLVLRRRGRETLQSTFVAIHEPFYGQPKITAARLLKVQSTNRQAIGLEIDLGLRRDTLLVSLYGAQSVRTQGQPATTMDGRLAVVSRSAEGRGRACLVGGTQLQQAELSLASAVPSYRGSIRAAVSRWDGAADNALVTDAKLPADPSLHGAWILAKLGDSSAIEAYEIDRIEVRDAETWIHLTDDPGLRSSGGRSREIFFPRREFGGPQPFVIYTHAEIR